MKEFEKDKLYLFNRFDTGHILLTYDSYDGYEYWFTTKWIDAFEDSSDQKYVGKSMPWRGADTMEHINGLERLNRPGKKELVRDILK